MKTRGYPVYRLNGVKNIERIGSILEFRKSRRSMNRLGLTKLARSIFASGPGDIIVVGYDSVLDREEFQQETVLISAG